MTKQCNSCCSCKLQNINIKLNELTEGIKDLGCSIQCLYQALSRTNISLNYIDMMLAHENPMTIAGSYPETIGIRYVIKTPVRFLDMLNTDMYLIYKTDSSSLGVNLPIYFRDADYPGSTAAYEHAVVLPDATPVLANQLIPNGIYKAKYQYTGGYIILNSLTPLNPNVIPV